MDELRFARIPLTCGYLGPESVVPDVGVQQNLQNRLSFDLGEREEIYEGYGQLPNAYPYRQQDTYARHTRVERVYGAILENDRLYAVFLPDYGGRLWQLYDKQQGRDLIYTNDCIRASNLAVRNAWFSGGVEWNCGVIGHTPFTMDRVFAAKLRTGERDVLRMYNYERIRGVVYQMDFWLEDDALNGHMSVWNPRREVVPMYWWTNIASPFYDQGRLLVPAHGAYTYDRGTIRKIRTPETPDGENTEHYETVRNSKDFFFDLDQNAPRWIANVDGSGKGLLHTSTRRLQSRKLFTWGQNPGSRHWQEFLTQNAGPYIEIQAGLGKTQYGCIPMAPHTVWEWTERFQSLNLTPTQQRMAYEDAVDSISAEIRQSDRLEAMEAWGESIRKLPATLVHAGTGDGALQEALEQKPLTRHLDFTSDDPRQKLWHTFLDTGILPTPEGFPAWDPSGNLWLERLRQSVQEETGQNWYAYYSIALLEREAGRVDLAEKAIRKSLSLEETPVGDYVYAVLLHSRGEDQKAGTYLRKALSLDHQTESFVKAVICLMFSCGLWSKTLSAIQMLPAELRENPRIRLCQMECLYHLGQTHAAQLLLNTDGGLTLADVREGELSTSTLWHHLYPDSPLPEQYNFNALGNARE